MDVVQRRWDARLDNWALWQVSGAAGPPSSPFPAYRLFASSRHWSERANARPQPLVGDALDTDRLVVELARESPERYSAVRAWYVWTGSLADRAAALRIHPDTLHDRVVAARYRLDDLALLRRGNAIRARMCVIAA